MTDICQRCAELERERDMLAKKVDDTVTEYLRVVKGRDERIAGLEADRNNLLCTLQQIFEGDYENGEQITIAAKALDATTGGTE